MTGILYQFVHITSHANDKLPGRVHASPSWIFIYSYENQDHNDTGPSNSLKSLVVQS